MRKLLSLVCLGGLLISCGDDSSSSPELLESSSSQAESSSSEKSSSSLAVSSSSVMSSSVESSSSLPYVEKHLAWNYLNPALSYGEVTDERDGHVYKYIEVDGYVRFMAENLNYSDSVTNPNLLASSWCPNNSLDSCSKYGRFYTWAAAMNVEPKYNNEVFNGKKGIKGYVEYQGLCPEGWLMYADEWIWSRVIRKKDVDYCAQEGWIYEGCTNELGFTALPGGYYQDGEFKEVGENFYYWSVQGGDKDTGGLGMLYAKSGDFGISFSRHILFLAEKTRGAPVRCYQMIPQDPCADPDNPYCSSSSGNVESSSDAAGTDIESSDSENIESSDSENVESSDSVPSSSSEEELEESSSSEEEELVD